MVRCGVRASIPGTQEAGQHLPGPVGAMVDEREQRMESEALLERWPREFLLAVRRHQRCVQVYDQGILCRRASARRMIAGQGPSVLTGSATGAADGLFDLVDVTGQGREQPGDCRIRGHGSIHIRLRSERRDVGQAVSTDREHEREIREDLPRIMTRELLPPRRQRPRQLGNQTRRADGLGQQHTAGLTDRGHRRDVNMRTWIQPGSIHPEGAP